MEYWVPSLYIVKDARLLVPSKYSSADTVRFLSAIVASILVWNVSGSDGNGGSEVFRYQIM